MPTAPATRRALRSAGGFTLLEVTFAVLMLGVLAKVAMMRVVTPATLTLQAQAQSVADLVRRAQVLAMARQRRITVSVTPGRNGRITMACATPSCPTDTSLTLQQGVLLGSAGTIHFNSLGQPVDGTGTPLAASTTYTLSYTTGGGTSTFSVTVAALTGRVAVGS